MRGDFLLQFSKDIFARLRYAAPLIADPFQQPL
jgi:hypothetical protein